MHEHSCQHELKNCEQCDLVYCTKCRKEWKNCHQSHWYAYWPTTWPYGTTDTPTTSVSWDGSTSISINCTHGE